MRHVRFWAGAALCSAALLPSPLSAQQWSAAQQEVWRAVEGLWAASESGSIEVWDATISNDYRGMGIGDAGPTTKAQGRPFREYFVSETTTLARSLVPLSIEIHGDVAIVLYGYQLINETPTDGVSMERGRWMDVYRNTGGRWLLIADYGGALSGG